MYKGKYAKLLLDGRWKVNGMPRQGFYELENVYNQNIIEITGRQLENVVNGETTVSKIISRRIGGGSGLPIDNGVVKSYQTQKAKHANERGKNND